MRILELKSFIENLVPEVQFFANRFPVSQYAPNDCAVVKLTGGFPPSDLGKRQPSFQIRVRGTDDLKCEEHAITIHSALSNLQNVKIGDSSVVIIRPMTSDPLLLGEDENNRIIYTMNFNCVVRPK